MKTIQEYLKEISFYEELEKLLKNGVGNSLQNELYG
tara:strand:- start:471 stop:578 length:108 start_codon:yes stop_codon:yes gene_type:complete